MSFFGLSNPPSEEQFAAACGMTVEAWREHMAKCDREQRNAYMIQVDALLLAGWSFELPEIVNHNPPKQNWSHTRSEPWQWYWRRPGPRGGRRFLSTSQAYNALQRGKP